MNTLGSSTKSVFHKEIPGDEIHHEFEVAAGQTIKQGMPVELAADGKVQPVTAATYQTTCIGIALQDRNAGELVTVGTYGHCIVNAEAKTPLSAGPVKWDQYNSVTGNLSYDDTSVTAANLAGWALNAAAAAGDEILVLTKGC